MSAPLRHALLVACLALCALLLRPATDAVAVALRLAPEAIQLAPVTAPVGVGAEVELVAFSDER